MPAFDKTTRRSRVGFIVTLAIVLVFAGRLVDLQLVQAPALAAAASQRRTDQRTIYGNRGEITDRNGDVLAESVVRYNITAAPDVAQDYSAKNAAGKVVNVTVRDAMSHIAALTGVSVDTLLNDISSDPKANFTYLVKGVDVDVYRKVTALSIPYIYLERTTARTYPDGAVGGNIVGFVGTDGPQAGLEYADNKCLAGKNGSESYEIGADGVELPGAAQTISPAIDGGTLTTTLDSNLQYEVQEELAQQTKLLAAQSASAIVMKVSDASLMAVADYPSVDPNNVNGTSTAFLGSKSFTALYEPGSIMKSLMAAALLDAGKATPTTPVTVPDIRHFPWGGSVADAESHPPENLTLTGVLQNSSNVCITLLAQDLTTQQRYDYLLKFGLGAPSAVDFPGEPTAPLPPASTWDQQTNYNSMFGQGISATAIQMANAYQAIANHGVRLPVKLVEKCTSSDRTVTDVPSNKGTRVVSAAAADETVTMLRNVLTNGTLDGMIPIPGYTIAAKTGTAQVADKPGGGYGDDFITSVAGLVPAQNPQYVVLVTFDEPTKGKTSAAVAPAFRAITSDVLQAFRIPPSTPTTRPFPSTW